MAVGQKHTPEVLEKAVAEAPHLGILKHVCNESDLMWRSFWVQM